MTAYFKRVTHFKRIVITGYNCDILSGCDILSMAVLSGQAFSRAETTNKEDAMCYCVHEHANGKEKDFTFS